MKSILKNYNQFINEHVTEETRDKIFNKAEEWAKSIGYDNVKADLSYDGGGYFMLNTPLGVWSLYLEASSKKSGQDSMYRQTYDKDRNNLKWYIKFPGRSNTYNHRSNTKAGSFNTFKKLFTEFQEVSKAFELARDFLNNFGVEIDVRKNSNFSGKNLKELGVTFRITNDGDLAYTYDKYEGEIRKFSARFKINDKYEREYFNPNTGDILYYSLLAAGLTEEAANMESARTKNITEIDLDNLSKSIKGLSKFKL